MINDAKRICIIGSSGSGKSTLALKLGKLLDLPVIHMDMHFWKPDWKEANRKQMYNEISARMKSGRWIVDGNYCRSKIMRRLMKQRFKKADLVVFIDMPLDECIASVTERQQRGEQVGLPEYLEQTKEEFDGLVEHIKYWHVGIKNVLLEMVDKFAKDKLLQLDGRRGVDEFLDSLNAQYM